jgi:hypothetical protein
MLSLGVLDFGRFILPPPGLPLRRLPATNLAQAFRILAVALIPAPRPVLLSTPLAQANPRPRSAAATIWLIMTLAHGSRFPKGQPGGTCYRSPRALFKIGNPTVVPIYTSGQEPDSEENGLRKARPKRRNNQTGK